ncbi:hypothetical protein LINPERPRIM_LOCUS30642, partial [Linum perenne]
QVFFFFLPIFKFREILFLFIHFSSIFSSLLFIISGLKEATNKYLRGLYLAITQTSSATK